MLKVPGQLRRGREAVSEAATQEATEAALAELERTLIEEQGANDNLNNVIETETTEP